MDEQIEQEEQEPVFKEELISCNKIDNALCGKIISLSRGKAEVFFVPTVGMACDDRMIHTGFVFGAASYAALCAINKRNSIVIGSNVKFLAPIEVGHELVFKADALQNDLKKCEVKVEAFLLDIKVFDAMFYIAVFEKSIFKLRLKDDEEA